ncbi:ribonuclease HII [Alphaproteobacteria bacterium]|jgi:ribonuclease HII|nr:ribonuclease HII [Alphaproteobacteria bacterium]MDB3974261.1 ribonuclease HII [Alphaproteobacteria bacterium]MDC0594883.1 ribonuclease HII [Alphaproteobacteria bacterium]OUX25492.1 MAG: ribonuclease HII [Pelagibacteraceae bacterium TMED259]|tara:strand:+ start:98 stop:700 length:603 start_codon:yes stop_codon:yes gene_type:complete
MSDFIIGVDEVGRGSLVGSVIICAFRSKNALFDLLPFSVKDSKKINKKQRESIYNYFHENKNLNCSYQITFGKKRDIEELNIHKVVLQSMSTAVKAISKPSDKIIIDGSFVPEDLKEFQVSSLIKADDKINQVSAASIIAKVFRDKLISRLHFFENKYGWNKNAGYGTKNHLEAINKYGISPFHRKTYQPISRLIKELST